MELQLIDNLNRTLRDDLMSTIRSGIDLIRRMISVKSYHVSQNIMGSVNADDNIKDHNPFSSQVLKELTSFLNIGPRYRFAFVSNADRVCHVPFVNIGHCVASFIHDNEHSDLKAECFSYVKQLISTHTQHHPEIGKYIYIKNIGIMFEPEIGLDVSMFLANISRNTLLLIEWKGETVYPYLYFLHSGSKHKLNLSQLNYITI